MKIEIQRESFLNVFSIAGSVAPTRSPKPVLETVKIEVTQSGTTLLATNMDIGMRLEVPDVTVHQPGVALLPVSRLSPFLRESRDQTLSIDVSSEKIVLKGNQSQVTLQARNPDEFPPVATFEEESYIQVKSSVLKQIIHRTVFATDNESSRFALGGVLLEFEEQSMTAVATDGRRLAKMQGASEEVGEVNIESMTIVPTASMQLIEKSLPDDDSEVMLAARANDILVKNGGTVIYSRLVEGRFPKWRDVFPTNRPDAAQIDLPVGDLHSAIRQAVVVADADSRGIDFEFTNGTLVLGLSCANIGESRVELPVNYDGPNLQITLDYRFIIDFLRVLDGMGTFSMEIENADRAALCTTSESYGYVIMPLARDRR
ncbi:MAG: DNA polymerase III subunit beta [Planctomycetota bacterium]|nr:DNA polymerase III subunit beta [Planctomycetota bacterium]